jgi:PhoH-like ATPase
MPFIKNMGTKKNFVLDTNVILHDYKCIENFQENDIYLPIVMLEELDRFKKGSDQLNYNAREFIRELDRITSDDLNLKGAPLGDGKGTLYVVTDDKYQKKIAAAFPEHHPDHRILSCVCTIAEKKPDMQTILVTKDVNLRMKARALGIPVNDYFTDKVINFDIFQNAQETLEDIDPDLIDKIYASHDGIDVSLLEFGDNLEPNACFILKSVRNSVLARYNSFTGKVKKVEKGNN